eukprot:1702338-Amphidinium_carterae.1
MACGIARISSGETTCPKCQSVRSRPRLCKIGQVVRREALTLARIGGSEHADTSQRMGHSTQRNFEGVHGQWRKSKGKQRAN